MSTLHTVWINLGIYTGTITWTILGIGVSPCLYLWLRFSGEYSSAEAVRKLIWIYGRVWVWMISLFIPVRLPKEMPPSPCILVANHTSFFDVYFVGAQPLWNVSMVVRGWPFKIIFYRFFMLAAQYINTEGSGSDHAIDRAVDMTRQGGSVLFFPEGTRSRNGALGRFYSGAFHTSLRAQVPVVPLVISGAGTMLPRGAWIIRPTRINIRLLPPIYPDKYIKYDQGHIAMRKDVKALMATALHDTTA